MSWLAAALPGLYLLLTSTTTLVPGIWPYDAKRMLQFVLLFLLFLLPALNRRIRVELSNVLAAMPAWMGWTLSAVFAWGVVSAVVNARSPMHLANSLSEVALLGSLVLGVFVVAACRRAGGRVFDQIAIGLLALTGLAVGLQELLGVAAAHAAGVDFNFRISLLHFSWPRFYNQLQSWTVPVITALPLLFGKNPTARIFCAVVLALHWYIILMTGARGTFIALSWAIAFAALFLPIIRKPLLGWQLVGIGLGGLLYGAVLLSFETAEGPQSPRAEAATSSSIAKPETDMPRNIGFYGNETESMSSFTAQSLGRPMLDPMGRTWMWKVAATDAKNHPLLGIGPMNYVCTSPVFIGHPHNFALQLAAEWGIPVAIAVCALFIVLLGRTIQNIRKVGDSRKEDHSIAAYLLTGVLAAALHSLVSGVMVMPASQVAAMLCCGLLLGSAQISSTRMPKRRSMHAHLLGILMSLGLFSLGYVELNSLAERSARLEIGEGMWPRIWQDARVCRLYSGEQAVRN